MTGTTMTSPSDEGAAARHTLFLREFPQELRLAFDPAGRCSSANRAARETLGRGDLPWQEAARRLFSGTLGQVIASGDCAEEDFTLATPAGDRVFNWRYFPRFGTAGELTRVILAGRDVSARTQADEQSCQARRMESVAALAGGVANEFNNILTMIMGAATILDMRLRDDAELGAFARQVLESSERAASLTQGLLAFGRRQSINRGVHDLNRVVADMREPLARVLTADNLLEVDTCPGPVLVSVDRGQIEQVLMNLAANARDAMPSGGTVEMRVALPASDLVPAAIRRAVSAPCALLVFGDRGCGMDESALKRVFEPFFGTRQAGGGGLGLSLSHGIVMQHGGVMTAESTPGRGSVFSIYLPLANGVI